MNENKPKNKEIKLCECGCGQPAPIAKETNKKFGWIKNEPLRFIRGHNSRLPNHPRPKGCFVGHKHTEETKRKCSEKKKRELNPNWKGGVKICSGYIYELNPEHPSKTKSGYVPQHRLVMEKYLARFLDPWEIPHHCNENTQDNKIENLELMMDSSHKSHHNTGKKYTQETKDKIGKASKGRIHTDKSKRKIGEANKGKPSAMKGKNHTEETKKKIREGGKRTWEKRRQK